MAETCLNTPILFLVFNRSDTTARVFDVLRKVRPASLYIAADGPRPHKDADREQCAAVRQVVSAVDWPCRVRTLFREENLGCKHAVSSAIDWFFSQEEMGIILEDDCLPGQGFFRFCEELLHRYRNDTHVGQVSGTNVLGSFDSGYSYHSARFGSIWGWATWRRAWDYYDVDMELWPSIRGSGSLETLIPNQRECEIRKIEFEKTYNSEIDTWDYQWAFARLINQMQIILPCKNLVSNIGFDRLATHTKDLSSSLCNIPAYPMEFPLRHPSVLAPSDDFEEKVFKKMHRRTICQKIVSPLTILKNRLFDTA